MTSISSTIRLGGMGLFHSLPRPNGWTNRRLRFLTRINKSQSIPLAPDDEVSFVPMETIGENGGIRLDQAKELVEIGDGYTYFADGDVVVAKITPCFENGKGAFAQGLKNGIAFGTTELHVIRSAKDINERFLFYLSISELFRKLGEGAMYGAGGQKRVPEQFIKDFVAPLPPVSQQQKIAAFLDRKTAEIDTLIAKKRRLLDLLADKRTALITRAVTKGLNPDAPMKDSGIEWLGEIPAHWDVMAVKFVLAMPITDGPHETPDLVVEGIPFLSAEAINNDALDFSKKRGFISEEDDARFSRKYSPKCGDIYIVKSGATTGKVARVETNDRFNIWSPLAALRPNKSKMSTNFLFYFAKSKSFHSAIELGWNYGTQQNIGMGVLSNLDIAVPPIGELERIARFVETNLDKTGDVMGKVEMAIEKLEEYRSALITNAVTGQIKLA